MINSRISFESLTYEYGLLENCLRGKNSKETIQNVIVMSSISKIFHHKINSNEFFRYLIYSSDPLHQFLLSKQNFENLSLKHKFLELRTHYLAKYETFPYLIVGKTEMLVDAHSSRYYSTSNDPGTVVDIYTADKNELLRSYKVNGQPSQVTIEDNLLCIVQDLQNGCTLVVYDLEDPEKRPRHIRLPGCYETPICFGKEYLIYVQSLIDHDEVYTLPLSVLYGYKTLEESPWEKRYELEAYLYFFSYKEGFLEVIFQGNYCSISKITMKEGQLIKLAISEKIERGQADADASILAVHFHDDRVFIAYEKENNEVKIDCYDLLSKKMVHLITFPSSSGENIQEKFVSRGEKIYYMTTGSIINKEPMTITYGKI